MKREEQACSYCGKIGCYADGLCRNCYSRKCRNGTPEYRKELGIDMRCRKRPEIWSDKTKQILELHRAGMPNKDIVKQVGLTRQAVSLVIHRHPTNAEKIRAMTDEELAEWLAQIDGVEIFQWQQQWIDWLKQEAT